MIKKMFKNSRKGIVFNSLSKYVDFENDKLFYTYPDKILKYCFFERVINLSSVSFVNL